MSKAKILLIRESDTPFIVRGSILDSTLNIILNLRLGIIRRVLIKWNSYPGRDERHIHKLLHVTGNRIM
jgi:hypothetical protein